MPPKRLWTAEEDAAIAARRARRASWEGIAREVRASRSAVIDRARLLGLPRQRPVAPVAEAPRLRGPLPPGHPLAWGAITAATLLDGAAYPFPPRGDAA